MSSLGLALTKNFLAKKTKLRPKFAIVLGSGFADAVDWLKVETTLDYANIPNFPRSSVGGHRGQLIFGHSQSGKAVVVFRGRAHYYEGLTMRDAAYPAYVAHALGASVLIVTNAAGGLNSDFAAGDLMLIRDHLNLMGDNPLRGPQLPKEAERFVAMRDAYDLQLFELALGLARRNGIKLQQGVYAAMSGPSYETEAELRMLYTLGADAVGMSTVPEVMAARQMGLRVMGLSVIANDAFPRRRHQAAEVSHDDVLRAVEQSLVGVRTIIEGVIESNPD